MRSNKEALKQHVIIAINGDISITEERLKELIINYSILCPIEEEEKEQILKEIKMSHKIKMNLGSVIKDSNFKPWFDQAKGKREFKFWDRYKDYLGKSLSPNVISKLDEMTDEMMDLIGNPNSECGFERRGLIIGDVQSGKTSTYIGMINKAVDCGFKVIILLTGTIEKLRQQTQERIDYGFTGIDSKAEINGNNRYVGVGNLNESFWGVSKTSISSDFGKNVANNSMTPINAKSGPVIFVLKKNKSVLDKIYKWLNEFDTNHGGKIDGTLPLLLIDDEADNASVNTKEDEVTAINMGIRKLLSLFDKSSYVGFTATPYANIFINPDSEDDMIEEDLFPRDFIYVLDPPSNYIGARSMFGEDSPYHYMLKCNDDCGEVLPTNHKKGADFTELPESLKEAICSFFIGNAIRDINNEDRKHRSMLINISRFIDVQENIRECVNDYVRKIQLEVRNYGSLGEKALQYKNISYIKMLYEKYFISQMQETIEWSIIQKKLYDAIAPIVVKSVNGGNASKNLNYVDHEHGLRIIAIGGLSLSRGLTLEGLMVSYFYRNSQMYDTLMQMGRWFGYRDTYKELCQVWMSDESIGWYDYISKATDDLRKQVNRMRDQNLTPKDFGLCVRSDMSGLIVTARNKMKSAKDFERPINYSGEVIETPNLFLSEDINKKNNRAIQKFITKLEKEGYNVSDQDENNLSLSNPQILNVKREYIIELLDNYHSHPLNLNFDTEVLKNIIQNNKVHFETWDISIATGEGDTNISYFGKSNKSVKRSFRINPNNMTAIQISGSKSRLGTQIMGKVGLTKEICKLIEEEIKKYDDTNSKKNFSEKDYFRFGGDRKPVLVIYPVELSNNKESVSKEIEEKIDNLKRNVGILYGLSIGIPKKNGYETIIHKFKMNVPKQKEVFRDYEEETDYTIVEGDE